MSILRILLKEQQDLFKLSYSLSDSRFSAVRDSLLRNLPDLNVNEQGDVFYGYLDSVDDAIFTYDSTRQIMNSDYTLSELLKLRARDFSE